mgnify:CR=1 FL=1
MAVITITKENFAQEVLQSEKPVLLDFWASWCGPCRMLSPIVDEVAEERGDVKVGKVNVDEQPELAGEFGVMSIPTCWCLSRASWCVRPWVPARRQCAGPAWVNMRAEKELLRHATAPSLLFPVQTHRKIVSLS